MWPRSLAARCFAKVKKILSPTLRSQCRGAQAGTPPGPGQRAGAPGCGAGGLQVLSYRASAASTFVQNAMFASLLPDASLLQAEGVDTMVFGRARLSWARPSFDSPGLFPPPPRDTANDTGTAELASRGRGRGFRSEERGDTRGARRWEGGEGGRGIGSLCSSRFMFEAKGLRHPSRVRAPVGRSCCGLSVTSYRIPIPIPANAMQPPHLRFFFMAACFEHGHQT